MNTKTTLYMQNMQIQYILLTDCPPYHAWRIYGAAYTEPTLCVHLWQELREPGTNVERHSVSHKR